MLICAYHQEWSLNVGSDSFHMQLASALVFLIKVDWWTQKHTVSETGATAQKYFFSANTFDASLYFLFLILHFAFKSLKNVFVLLCIGMILKKNYSRLSIRYLGEPSLTGFLQLNNLFLYVKKTIFFLISFCFFKLLSFIVADFFS